MIQIHKGIEHELWVTKNSFATNLLEPRTDSRDIQEILGHPTHSKPPRFIKERIQL